VLVLKGGLFLPPSLRHFLHRFFFHGWGTQW
jgi:hypothetical protein